SPNLSVHPPIKGKALTACVALSLNNERSVAASHESFLSSPELSLYSSRARLDRVPHFPSALLDKKPNSANLRCTWIASSLCERFLTMAPFSASSPSLADISGFCSEIGGGNGIGGVCGI